MRIPPSLKIVSILFILTACKENDPGPSSTELLQRKGGWELLSSTINPGIKNGNQIITDTYPNILPCHKDDIYVFEPGGKFSIIDKVKCSPSEDDDMQPGKYVYDEQKKLLSINGELGTEVEVYTGILKFKLMERIDGIGYVLTLTYQGK